MNLDYRIAFINNQARLEKLGDTLQSVPVIALDIETINWWNPMNERVALIQLAYRVNGKIRAVIIDALAQINPSILRQPLELHSTTKVMHNAAFDAVRLRRHFQISTAPIHDTLLAARRSGEKRYSLKAQVEKHLNLPINKSSQQSDWSVRPLHPKQLSYAALDAVATLLLYEHQVKRGLDGDYQLRTEATDEQVALPLADSLVTDSQDEKETLQAHEPSTADKNWLADQPSPARIELSASSPPGVELSLSSLALLGVIAELGFRYSPEKLAVSVDDERVGLSGWIIDGVLGRDAEIDESTAKLRIAGLRQRGLIRITGARRLEASEAGHALWHKHKPV